MKLYPMYFSTFSSSFSYNSMPCSGCSALHAPFLSLNWLNLRSNPFYTQKPFYKSKHSIKKKDTINQVDKFETYNYTETKRLTARVNDYFKVKLHGLVRPLNFISLGMDFLDPLDQRVTDLLFQTTFKYWCLNSNYIRI